MTQQPVEQSNTYTTADLGLSTALLCVGLALIDLDRSNPRKVRFIFGDQVLAARYENEFWSDRLNVNARAYFDNMKMLKARIYG